MNTKNRARSITSKCRINKDVVLTFHERSELRIDFDIDVEGYDVLIALTKEEYDDLKGFKARKAIRNLRKLEKLAKNSLKEIENEV